MFVWWFRKEQSNFNIKFLTLILTKNLNESFCRNSIKMSQQWNRRKKEIFLISLSKTIWRKSCKWSWGLLGGISVQPTNKMRRSLTKRSKTEGGGGRTEEEEEEERSVMLKWNSNPCWFTFCF
jgi:hypothetical protein